jgi:trans-aconitate methyltransferase
MQDVLMSYTWNANDYAQHSAGQERWARELIPLLNLQPDDRVLDIGCGDGRVTASIAPLVARGSVLGIDSSTEMIRHAGSSFAGVANLSFEQRDALALGYQNEFTVIFSNAVLHWIRDQRRVVHEIARALRPSGRVLVQCGGQGNGQEVIDSFTRVASQDRWAQYFAQFESSYAFYSDRDYELWLKDAELSIDELRLIPKDMIHADVAAFEGWLRTAWHPYTSRVPESERTEFIESVTRDYTKTTPPDTDGRVHVLMIRLQFRAHKAA